MPVAIIIRNMAPLGPQGGARVTYTLNDASDSNTAVSVQPRLAAVVQRVTSATLAM